IVVTLLAGLLQTSPTHPLDNDYVRVTRNGAPCSAASPSVCGERVLVALGPIEFRQYDQPRRLQRGEIAVFRWHESYVAPTKGERKSTRLNSSHGSISYAVFCLKKKKKKKKKKRREKNAKKRNNKV